MATSQDPLAWQRQFCKGQWKEQEGEEDRRRDGKIISRMDGNRVLRFPEGSRRQGRMERYSCKVICGAPTTSKDKRLRVRWDIMETTYADSWSDMAQSCDIDLWVMKWRSAWPIFHGTVILPSWLFDVCTSYLGIMNQYDPRFDRKINVGHCDLYFMVQWFYLVSGRLFDVWTSLFGIMNQYDPRFALTINVNHCDLYFMVQWFCIISWRLFDVWTSYFRIMGQHDQTFDLRINVGHCDLFFMVRWCCLISWRLLMYVHHTSGLWINMTWSFTSK